MKEQITLEDAIATQDRVHITSSATIFCNEARTEEISIKKLEKLYSQVIKQAKEIGATISYKNKTKATLKALASDYASDLKAYNELFDKLVSLCKAKLEKGIFVGCSDDVELKEIFNVRNKLMEYHYRSAPMSKIEETQYRLNELKTNLTPDSAISKICL